MAEALDDTVRQAAADMSLYPFDMPNDENPISHQIQTNVSNDQMQNLFTTVDGIAGLDNNAKAIAKALSASNILARTHKSVQVKKKAEDTDQCALSRFTPQIDISKATAADVIGDVAGKHFHTAPFKDAFTKANTKSALIDLAIAKLLQEPTSDLEDAAPYQLSL